MPPFKEDLVPHIEGARVGERAKLEIDKAEAAQASLDLHLTREPDRQPPVLRQNPVRQPNGGSVGSDAAILSARITCAITR